jgi:16S rRNA (uracil1498-N3)-methyltransferase
MAAMTGIGSASIFRIRSLPGFVALAVGPEGGFSPREVSLFMAAGFRPLLMGNTILRTETAALYGTAAIRIILLESKAWMPRPTESCSSKSPWT